MTTTTTHIIPQFTVPPLRRAALTAVLYRPTELSAVLAGVDTTPAVGLDVLYLVCAQAFQTPMTNVHPLAQVGRFVLAAYTPQRYADPDAVLTLANGRATATFHRAVRAFQQARRTSYHETPSEWYRRVMGAAHGLVSPLWALSPTRSEAAFVLHWAVLTAARGRSIPANTP